MSRTAGRAVRFMHLVMMGHLFNPFWRSRDERRKTRYAATFNSSMRYLKRYAPQIRKMTTVPVDGNRESERAFSIWFQGEDRAPELVKACFRSMRRHLKQELVVLDENTIFDWITLPDHIVRKWREGKIPHTQFSDICRIELLYQHGGLWFDATDYLTAPVPDYIMDENLFLFMAGRKVRGSYAFIQSCFMRARKGNPVMGVWREANALYWKEENSKINYFVHHLLLRLCVDVNETVAENFALMPKVDQDPTHMLWGEHCADKYDASTFRALTEQTFFQKTSYKDSRLRHLPPGSIAEYMISR